MRELSGDATSALLRVIGRRLAGADWRIVDLASSQWASITFTGARHRLVLMLAGVDVETAADRFADGLGDAELPLKGHILADIAIAGRESLPEGVRLIVEALTVEDG